MEKEVDDEDIVLALLNLVKRIQRLEKWQYAVDTCLTCKFRMPKVKDCGSGNSASANRSARHFERQANEWEDWGRKLLGKLVEFLVVIIAALIGLKIGGFI